MSKESEVPLTHGAPPTAPPPGYSEATGLDPSTAPFIIPTDPNVPPQQQGFGNTYYYQTGRGGVPVAVDYARWQANRDVVRMLRNEPEHPNVPNLGANSIRMVCPVCGEEMNTKITRKAGVRAYVAGCMLCAAGCFCGCCLIPCFLRACQDPGHTCSKCDAFLGTYYKYETL